LEITSLRKDAAELRTKIAQYESRIELAPAAEQRLSELQQAQDDSRIHYESLLQKKLQSEIATNLEKRQQGERFQVVEPANLPRQPEGKRRIIILGWLLAIVAGLAAGALREMADSTVYGEAEVMRYSSIPVLASIPMLLSAGDRRRKHWSSGIEAAAALVLVLLAIGAAGHSYFGL
jgi:capsular polysaccharide biosynthesis protein